MISARVRTWAENWDKKRNRKRVWVREVGGSEKLIFRQRPGRVRKLTPDVAASQRGQGSAASGVIQGSAGSRELVHLDPCHFDVTSLMTQCLMFTHLPITTTR